MAISWIKAKSDTKSFRTFQNLGFHVVELDNLEETDETIKDLIDNHYNTIIVSNEVAGNSSDIIKKYKNEDNINIIITPRKS